MSDGTHWGNGTNRVKGTQRGTETRRGTPLACTYDRSRMNYDRSRMNPSLCDDHGFHQYVALIMKMLSAGARNIRPIEDPKRKSPLISESSRFCVHTKYSVEPGMYSQRSTALPRSDLQLKSGLPKENGLSGP